MPRPCATSQACLAHPSEHSRASARPTPHATTKQPQRAAAARRGRAVRCARRPCACRCAHREAQERAGGSSPSARRPCAVSSIAAARRLRTCAGMPHRGMTAGRRWLRICCRCAVRASCPRIAPPERRGHAPHRRRSRHAHAAAAACYRRIGDLSGARLRCDGSGPVWQAPIGARYAAQRRAHAAHTRRTPFASDDRRPAAAAPAGAAVGWGGRRRRRRGRGRWRCCRWPEVRVRPGCTGPAGMATVMVEGSGGGR